MIYKLFIQTDREGKLENFFFDTIEELTAKKAELDAEIEAAKAPGEGGAAPGGGGEAAPVV